MSALTDDSIDLFGKKASDLQENIVLDEEASTGTLHYIEDYSAAFPLEPSGNFIVLKAASDAGVTITAEVVGGDGPKTLDEDGICLARIAEGDTAVKFVATNAAGSTTLTYDVTGITKEEEE